MAGRAQPAASRSSARRLARVVAEELDEQQRVGVALERSRRARRTRRCAREVEDGAVHQLDRRAASSASASPVAATRRRWNGSARRAIAARGGARHEPHARLGDDDQRPLRADDELGEVELRVGEPVEPVAAGLAPVAREALGDRLARGRADSGSSRWIAPSSGRPAARRARSASLDRLEARPACRRRARRRARTTWSIVMP